MTTWNQIMDLVRAMEERRGRTGRVYGAQAARLLAMLREFHRTVVAEPQWDGDTADKGGPPQE